MKKRILAIILALSLLFLCVPQIIFAADGDVTLNIENGDISITETGYKQANGSLIEHSGNYILTGIGSHKVSVSGTTCSITLKNLNMTDTNSYGLEIGNGSNITLIISGSNTITRGGYEGDSVPIGVMEGSSLTIKGETNDNGANVLNAIGTSDGKAAIGGS